MGEATVKKVVVEVEVPGELSDMEPLLRDAIRQTVRIIRIRPSE